MAKTQEDVLFDETVNAAIEGAKAVKEFLVYRGSNNDYEKRARSGGSVLSTYARIKGTRANEEALRQKAAGKKKTA